MESDPSPLGMLVVVGILAWLIPVYGLPAAAATIVIINEVDSDTPGIIDSAEFVELFDGGVGNTLLDGLVVVFYSPEGPFDVTYGSVDLDGVTTDDSGYAVICGQVDATFAPICDVDSPVVIRNGPSAVTLYEGNASDFPGNRAIHTNGLADAVVYGTSDADDPELLVLVNPGQPQVDEDGAGDGAAHSNQRCPNGSGGARNTETYAQFAPTTGAVNGCGAAPPPTTTTSTSTSTTTTSSTTTSTTSTTTTTTTTTMPPPPVPDPGEGSDREPPRVKAELDRISVKHDRGWFRIDFSCRDRVDRRPVCVADLNGIRVRDGQKVYLTQSSDTRWTKTKGHTLYIKDDNFVLTVTGTDDAGNSATGTSEPHFRHRGHRWHWR